MAHLEKVKQLAHELKHHVDEINTRTDYLKNEGYSGVFDFEIVNQEENGSDEGYTLSVVFYEISTDGVVKNELDAVAGIETHEEGMKVVKQMVGSYKSSEYVAFGPYRRDIQSIGEITQASLYIHRLRFKVGNTEQIIETSKRYTDVELPITLRDVAEDIRMGLHLHVRMDTPRGTQKVYTKKINISINSAEEYEEWADRIEAKLRVPAHLLSRDASLSHLKQILVLQRDRKRGEYDPLLDIELPHIK